MDKFLKARLGFLIQQLEDPNNNTKSAEEILNEELQRVEEWKKALMAQKFLRP